MESYKKNSLSPILFTIYLELLNRLLNENNTSKVEVNRKNFKEIN